MYNNQMPTDELFKSERTFVEYINKVWEAVSNLGIDLGFCYVDHIGIRINWGPAGEGDYSRYVEAKNYLESKGAFLISEAIIPMNENGRPISIYSISNRLKTKGGQVMFIEVPAPRRGRIEAEGPDHIEIVLPLDISLASFAAKNREILLTKISLEDLEKSLENEAKGLSNPDITIDLGAGLRVKFHTKHIGTVVNEEQAGMPLLEELAAKFNNNNPGVMSVIR